MYVADCRSRNPEKWKARNTAEVIGRMRKRKTLLVKLLGGKCFDCRRRYPSCCFHFDHRNPKSKKYNLARILNYGLSTLLSELVKCDLVCANCHAVRSTTCELVKEKVKLGYLRIKGARINSVNNVYAKVLKMKAI